MKEECDGIVSAVKRILRRWTWIEKNRPEWVSEIEKCMKPGRPKTPAVAKKKVKIAQGVVVVIKTYCEAFKARYGVNPAISGKASGQLKTLTKDFGEAKACRYVQAYLNMSDSFYILRRHDLNTFMLNLNAIQVFAEKGSRATVAESKQMDLVDHNERVHQEFLRGEK